MKKEAIWPLFYLNVFLNGVDGAFFQPGYLRL
jgi:hypothetical protein